jgi:hypothetical protein
MTASLRTCLRGVAPRTSRCRSRIGRSILDLNSRSWPVRSGVWQASRLVRSEILMNSHRQQISLDHQRDAQLDCGATPRVPRVDNERIRGDSWCAGKSGRRGLRRRMPYATNPVRQHHAYVSSAIVVSALTVRVDRGLKRGRDHARGPGSHPRSPGVRRRRNARRSRVSRAPRVAAVGTPSGAGRPGGVDCACD